MTHFTTFKATGRGAKLALVALVAAGVLGVGTAAAADTGSDGPARVVVKYSEQSLSTDIGVKQLYAQIVRAANQVCPSASTWNLMLQQRIQECRNQAIARAVHQVGNSQLAALYAIHSTNG
jgi:UrcA family protein